MNFTEFSYRKTTKSCDTSTCDRPQRTKLEKARLQQLRRRREMLERKMVDYNLMKKDIEDLEIQMKNLLLTIKNVSEIQQQSYDSVSRDLDELTSKYEETTSAVNKLRQENHELECDIQVKTCQEKQKRNEVNRLEIKKKKTKECIAEYNKKIQERVETMETLKREEIETQKLIEDLTVEIRRTNEELDEERINVQKKTEMAAELRRRNTAAQWTLEELTAESSKQEAALEALRKTGPEKLADVDRSADAVAIELAEARCAAAEWKAKRESAVLAQQRLKEAKDEEARRARAAVATLAERRDRLTGQLVDAKNRLAAADDENRWLVAEARDKADRLADVEADIDQLEQRICRQRAMFVAQRAQRDIEIATHDTEKRVKQHTLELLQSELQALQGLPDQRGLVGETEPKLSDAQPSEKALCDGKQDLCASHFPSSLDLCNQTPQDLQDSNSLTLGMTQLQSNQANDF